MKQIQKEGRRRIRSLRPRIALLLSVFFLFTTVIFSGCTATEEAEIQKGSTAATHKINYIVNNKLEISNDQSGDWEIEEVGPDAVPIKVSKNHFSISGLKDKKIEKAINEKIMTATAELEAKALPPYRGIKRVIGQGKYPDSISLYVVQCGNYNNILSLQILKDMYFTFVDEKGEQSGCNVNDRLSLNIDLNTGQEIALEQLFDEDADGKQLIDAAVEKRVRSVNPSAVDDQEDPWNEGNLGYGSSSWIEPFQGIPENQKFILYPNGLCLLLDYNNPEYDGGFCGGQMTLDYGELGDAMVHTERFYDPDVNLYESEEAPSYSLLYQGIAEVNQKVALHQESDDLSMSSTINYPSGLPHWMVEKAKTESMVDVDAIQQEYKKAIGEADETQDTGRQGYYRKTTNVNHVGCYYVLSSFEEKYFGQSISQGRNQNTIYKEGNQKPLALSELFREDYDYTGAILKQLEDQQKMHDWELPYDFDKNAELVIKRLQIDLQSDSLNLIVNADEQVGLPELWCNWQYQDIGFDHLTLFDFD